MRFRITKLILTGCLAFALPFFLRAESHAPATFHNPILPGYHPDPSVCRVGDDYYMVNSSFVWFPGMPIYHSRDLVNWELIANALDRPSMMSFEGQEDNNGIYAVTIRYHEGLFYLISTAVGAGGNFFMTAKDPRGPWSDPIFIHHTPGIDASFFFDEDGRCYYTGNTWDFPRQWDSQCGIWLQELDLTTGQLTGRREIITFGHAANARNTEAPHLYKIDGKYVLMVAEGGTEYMHSVTVHRADSIWGPYVPDYVNPVMTHRNLGDDYPIQCTGHADLVQTQNGEWYSPMLATRVRNGKTMLGRETFLCKVRMQADGMIYNPGEGKILEEMERPALPWTPVERPAEREDFDAGKLPLYWYGLRMPHCAFYTIADGNLNMIPQEVTLDDYSAPSLLMRKIQNHCFEASCSLNFRPKADEEAGLTVLRSSRGYYAWAKTKNELRLYRKDSERKSMLLSIPYKHEMVFLKVVCDGDFFRFFYRPTEQEDWRPAGEACDIDVICDNEIGNRFNGPGVGMYATGNGKISSRQARFDWFELR